MNHRYTRIVLTVLTASSLFACATSTPRPETSLYERLGGKPAIEAVVNDFIDRVGQDARITHLPRPERVPVLKARLTDLVCQATGGPCEYGGRDMKTAHAGMGITGDEFEAVVDDLVETLNKYEVPQPEQSEILALLAPMRPDIVEARH
jgi:hemoglobin